MNRAKDIRSTGSIPAHRTRKWPLIGLGVATVAFDVALTIIDSRLKQTGGPSILGLEWAGSSHAAEIILMEWGTEGRALAKLSLWVDFGFMACYGSFLYLATLATRDFARENHFPTVALLGAVAPWLPPAAVIFDAAENVIWLLLLQGEASQLARLATQCAIAKFLLVGLVIGYLLVGLAARAARFLCTLARG